jgi:hypothetical protein
VLETVLPYSCAICFAHATLARKIVGSYYLVVRACYVGQCVTKFVEQPYCPEAVIAVMVAQYFLVCTTCGVGANWDGNM